jgi:hypothetical protein
MSERISPRLKYREENLERWNQMEDHLDALIGLRDQLQPQDKVLLVGRNATGKSLFRSLLRGQHFGIEKLHLGHSSMSLRTGSFSELGGLSSMFRDMQGTATSVASLQHMETAIKSCQSWLTENKTSGIHIDEPEVGCSEELQESIGPWLRTTLDALNPTPVITLVTTHSRTIAKNFQDWKFIDTGFDYKTADEWLNRKPKPLDMEELQKNARTLFLVIVERQEQAKAEAEKEAEKSRKPKR